MPYATRKAQRTYVGVLVVREARSTEFGRTLMVANLLNTEQEPALAPLYDAATLLIENSRLRLRGFEVTAGVQFAQVWDIKVMPC